MSQPFNISSNLSEKIQVMFGLEGGVQIRELLPALWSALEDVSLPLRDQYGTLDLTENELSMLAYLVPRKMAKHLAGLKGGDPVVSTMQGRAGKFVRVGPCGWPICDFEGQNFLSNPTTIQTPAQAEEEAAARVQALADADQRKAAAADERASKAKTSKAA